MLLFKFTSATIINQPTIIEPQNMGTKLNFDPKPYLNTGHIELSIENEKRRSEAWKYFGFLKYGNAFPDGKKYMFCSLCWKKGIPLGFVVKYLNSKSSSDYLNKIIEIF